MTGGDTVGTVLGGRYRIEKDAGPGHDGGRVLRGRDVDTGARVVIRCPRVPEGLPGSALETAEATFVKECAALAAIAQRSSDVERVLASGIERGPAGRPLPYVVFEWLAGRSLAKLMAEQGPVSLGEAVQILEPAARALGIVHELGAFHGDIRPANLWLAEGDGRTTLKVAASTLATRLGAGPPPFAPEYGAAEHFKPAYGAIGPATDVYGLALVVVEMVAGTRALVGNDEGELYLATSDLARRPTLKARGAHSSAAVETVLTRALAVDPRRRYPNVKEFWAALHAALPELAPAAETSGSGSSEGLGGSRGLGWLALVLGAAALFGVGILIARLLTPQATPKPTALPSATAPTPASVAPPLPAPEPPPKADGRATVSSFASNMVLVAPAVFVMGGKDEGKPAHRVEVTHAFYIDRVEIRADAYARCVEARECTPSRNHEGLLITGTWGCNTAAERPSHPANCIDRGQAAAYCAFVGKRLPTEAEWELAARGTDGRLYPWGDAAPTTCAQAVVSGVTGACSERRGTAEVGLATEGASPSGALDMAGNVWEWVADGYQPYAPEGDAATLVDPRVALATNGRGVLRGGSWDYGAPSARVSYRLPMPPMTGNGSTGGRCARDAGDGERDD
ncbi:MAG: hypothetical protein JWP97_589 [Labilithrix sp.]|nr:hypothetical protein [Labilithrix sp.]